MRCVQRTFPSKVGNQVHAPTNEMSHTNHPSSVIWNDLDLYDNYRDFTTDPATFPAEEVRNFISALVRFL